MTSIKCAFINGTSVRSACVYKHCFPEAEGAEENGYTADNKLITVKLNYTPLTCASSMFWVIKVLM